MILLGVWRLVEKSLRDRSRVNSPSLVLSRNAPDSLLEMCFATSDLSIQDARVIREKLQYRSLAACSLTTNTVRARCRSNSS